MISALNESGFAVSARPYPIADARRAEVLYDYSPDEEFSAQQLTLARGDVVWVLEQHPCGWWGGHKDGNVHTGWFPEAVVKLTGDDLPDDSVAEDSRWAHRCSPSSPAPADMALRTSDHRAVASPQAHGRRRGSAGLNERTSQDHSAAAELVQANQVLEQELAAERRRFAEAAETMKSAEAKIAQLKQEQSLRMKQMESERERERQAFDRERQDYDAKLQGWAHERQQLHRRACQLESENKAQEGEVKRLQDELKRKEGELCQQMTQLRALEAAAVSRERSEAAASAALDRARSEDASHHLTSSTNSARDFGRGASAGVSRRLFAAGALPEARLEGMRTPPAAPPSVVPQVTAVPTTSTMPSSMPTMPVATVSTVTPLSARGSHLPRPSPRAASASAGMQWMHAAGASGTSTGPPPSPHHIHRAFTAGRDHSVDHAAQQAAVRGLVEAFERRSNSQGAPQVRMADPSPNRQLIYAAARRPAAGSSSRAASREVVGRRDHIGDETPTTGKGLGEDSGMAMNFGMSPMTRAQGAHYVSAGPPSSRAAAVASSPSAKASVSVQDRIRQLNTQRTFR